MIFMTFPPHSQENKTEHVVESSTPVSQVKISQRFIFIAKNIQTLLMNRQPPAMIIYNALGCRK
jgi:hypothetical protein